MNEPTENKKGLLHHSIFMFVATQLANVANMLFQFVAGRKLPDDEYGVLAAMLSIYLVASTPIDALRTAMAHFTQTQQSRARVLLRYLSNRDFSDEWLLQELATQKSASAMILKLEQISFGDSETL